MHGSDVTRKIRALLERANHYGTPPQRPRLLSPWPIG